MPDEASNVGEISSACTGPAAKPRKSESQMAIGAVRGAEIVEPGLGLSKRQFWKALVPTTRWVVQPAGGVKPAAVEKSSVSST